MSCFSNHLKADLRRNNMWSNQNSQGWRIRLWTLYEDHSPMFLVHIQIFIPPTSCELLVPVFWDQPGGLQPATVKNRRLFRDIFRLTSENFWVGWHSRNFDKSGDWVGCTPNPNVGPPMGKFLYKAYYIKYQVRGTPLVVPWISLLNIVTFYKPRFLHFFLKKHSGKLSFALQFFSVLLIWPTGVYKKATLDKETKPSKQHEETVQRLLEENVMNHSQTLGDLNYLFVDISFSTGISLIFWHMISVYAMRFQLRELKNLAFLVGVQLFVTKISTKPKHFQFATSSTQHRVA